MSNSRASVAHPVMNASLQCSGIVGAMAGRTHSRSKGQCSNVSRAAARLASAGAVASFAACARTASGSDSSNPERGRARDEKPALSITPAAKASSAAIVRAEQPSAEGLITCEAPAVR